MRTLLLINILCLLILDADCAEKSREPRVTKYGKKPALVLVVIRPIFPFRVAFKEFLDGIPECEALCRPPARLNYHAEYNAALIWHSLEGGKSPPKINRDYNLNLTDFSFTSDNNLHECLSARVNDVYLASFRKPSGFRVKPNPGDQLNPERQWATDCDKNPGELYFYREWFGRLFPTGYDLQHDPRATSLVWRTRSMRVAIWMKSDVKGVKKLSKELKALAGSKDQKALAKALLSESMATTILEPKITIDGENLYALTSLDVFSLGKRETTQLGCVALIITPEYLAIEFFTGG